MIGISDSRIFDSCRYDEKLTAADVRRLIRIAIFPSSYILHRGGEASATFVRREIVNPESRSGWDLLGRKQKSEAVENIFRECLQRGSLIDNKDRTYSRRPPGETKVTFWFRGETHTCSQSEYESYVADLRANAAPTINRKIQQLEEELQKLKT